MAPRIHVDSVRRIVEDGNHNAFTDLIRFGDRLYLSYRMSPRGHLDFKGSWGVIIVSDDNGETWRESYRFGVPDRDVRDPHLVALNGRLFAYAGTWLVEEKNDVNHCLGYCVWTDDGENWHGPQSVEGTYGHYVWRCATYHDTIYLCARRKYDFIWTDDPKESNAAFQSVMMESDDGFRFRPAGFFDTHHADETAFVFADDGSVTAVMRTIGTAPPYTARVCRSHPPYTEWERADLNRFIGGPMLAQWGNRLLVGGRLFTDGAASGTETARTFVGWLEGDQIVGETLLPSGGDTSYPGFVLLSDSEGLLSYYSSHEGSGTKVAPCHIYLARLRLE